MTEHLVQCKKCLKLPIDGSCIHPAVRRWSRTTGIGKVTTLNVCQEQDCWSKGSQQIKVCEEQTTHVNRIQQQTYAQIIKSHPKICKSIKQPSTYDEIENNLLNHSVQKSVESNVFIGANRTRKKTKQFFLSEIHGCEGRPDSIITRTEKCNSCIYLHVSKST